MMGQQVYDVTQIPVEGVSLAVTENIAAAGSEKAVETVVRSGSGKAEALSDDPEFKRLAALGPKEAWAVAYIDGRTINDFMLSFLKKSDEADKPDDDAETEDGDADRFSQFVWRFMPMIAMAGQMEEETVKAQARYQSQMLFTIGTKGTSLELNAVQAAPPDEN
jgi:hypothetical protein